MIEITPAILENEFEALVDALEKFLQIGNIEVDVCGKSFAGNDTPDVDRVLSCESLWRYDEIRFHLMVDDAQNQLNSLLNSSLTQKKIEIYLHQNEGFLATLSSKLPLNWKIGVYVLKDEELNDLNFYNNFDEVLFMTVSIGFQGGEFDTRVLSKVDRLRSLGYNGKVSVDGGVNLETAKLLRGHNIDRVSVGNYFKKSRNVEYDYEELYQALNE